MKVRLVEPAATDTAPLSRLVTDTTTLSFGFAANFTLNVPDPPSVIFRLVGSTTRTATPIVKVCSAFLLAASVTVYVYVFASWAFAGVPDSVRVLRVTPAGSSGDRPYVYGGVPPVAAGRVFETSWPFGQT